jgi:N6-L-threonylcarbamoyladenine synthase
MKVLGIETSCDDSAVGIVDSGKVLASVVHTQQVHAKWGGVIPELASRDHVRTIIPVIREALSISGLSISDIEGISACRGPGLLGSLLVGLCVGKSMAYGLGIPFVGVHHLEGHLLAAQIGAHIEPPYLALIVSGGHSHIYEVPEAGNYILIGKTRDDAAGEAFDKGAKLLRLPYPGGPSIQNAATGGNPSAFDFPRAMQISGETDMSFSGLKTALLLEVEKHGESAIEGMTANLAASYQEAIVDALIWKLNEAAEKTGHRKIAVVGGVSANARFREKLGEFGDRKGWDIALPPMAFCTDNGAMIAAAGEFRFLRGEESPQDITAVSRWPLEDL